MLTVRLFVDLDGTVADFNVPNALNRFENEVGFFRRLKPLQGVEVVNELAKSIEVYVISASPNLSADVDKRRWVGDYLPNVGKTRTLLCRNGQNKARQVKRLLNIEDLSNCYLLDDYTKNLQEWQQAGGIGIKRLTKQADNSTKKWKGLEVKDLKELVKIIAGSGV